MTRLQKNLIRLPDSRLSRRIVIWVFLSVIIIETIIFFPSLRNREKELLKQIKEVSAAKVSLIVQFIDQEHTDKKILSQFERLMTCPVILGGSLYDSAGQVLGKFGKSPEMSITAKDFREMTARRNSGGTRYDVLYPVTIHQQKYFLNLRHDASSVKDELYAFFLRISGLVIIISAFVTFGAWIALNPIVVRPILKLRQDLIKAGEAISKDRKTPDFYSANVKRNDELGEVIDAFSLMFRQISEAIANRKTAEAALQESLRQVENYSKMLNAELEKGRQMQNNFLPSQLLNTPGWEMAAFFRPAHQVAGDFYDVFELPNNSVGIVIADVCDKGVGAALFMALFRSLIRIFSGQAAVEGLVCDTNEAAPVSSALLSERKNGNPDRLTALRSIQFTNDYIANNHGDLAMFATLFFGVLNPTTGSLIYINGGHEPIFLIDGGRLKDRLTATGPAVGVQAGIDFRIGESQLEPGDILLAYTDGVTEAVDADHKFFTRNRLQSALTVNASTAAELIQRISSRLADHMGEAEQNDDITMLAIRRLDDQ
ncbi:PP2C family protein-serine/threonine phosphatase [Thermodesulfobacteriota bacterium]